MIYIFIAIIAVIAILLDWGIYHQLSKRYTHRPRIKKIYAAIALSVNLGIILALVFYSRAVTSNSVSFTQAILWIIWLFFLTIIPKAVYMLFSVTDFLIGLIRKRKTRWLTWVGLSLGIIAFFTMIWGATVGRTRIRVEEVEIASEKLPASFEGYRVALIADLHLGNYTRHNTLIRRMAEKVNELSPDMVIHAGDLVNLSALELTPEMMRVLGNIQAPDGTYSVLGNHDLGFYLRENYPITPQESVMQLMSKQKQMGWRLMQNETDYIIRGQDSITISGLNYPEDGLHNGRDSGLGGTDLVKTYAGIADSLFNITISHTPQNWDEILTYGYADLTVAGHVHAMQLKFSLGCLRWSPARWLYENWSGLYELGEKYLYVNDGIGFVMYPMRIGARPEITVFTLRRKG